MDANTASSLPSSSCMRSIRQPALLSTSRTTTRIRETLMVLQQPLSPSSSTRGATRRAASDPTTVTTDNFDHLRNILGQACQIAEEAEQLLEQIDWESSTEGFDDDEPKQ